MKHFNKIILSILVIFTTVSFRASEKTAVTPIVNSGTLTIFHVPLFTDLDENQLCQAKIAVTESSDPVILKQVVLHFSDESSFDCISSISVVYTGLENGTARNDLFATGKSITSVLDLKGNLSLNSGTHLFSLNFGGKKDSDPKSGFELMQADFLFENGEPLILKPASPYKFYSCKVLRARGQDNCDTYRIPGLVTTNKGTLIAVYDNRYKNSGDLQGDIDIGMSRSTDSGHSWEPMKVIMDMDEWGNRPQAENGIGDPCVLVDTKTNTIWVAALWFHGHPGKSAWGNSQPGLNPSETGQLMLVRSNDDGKTWSKPVSITSQVKNPAWYLCFQGPGRGITLNNGTLVFPAQFKNESQVPFSTIIYSSNRGKSWRIGTGAKSNTTESQVVQLRDNSLMINMRDDRNRTDKGVSNGRAVATTNDLGKTWITHPSSNSALPEPNCMASLISTKLTVSGKKHEVLFFSNPDNKFIRANMTIKASTDEGMTWPEKYQIEVNQREGYGYSCLTMVDDNTVGILYEGVKELYFQKIPVSDILKDLK